VSAHARKGTVADSFIRIGTGVVEVAPYEKKNISTGSLVLFGANAGFFKPTDPNKTNTARQRRKGTLQSISSE
jgi:hypothetical protein